MNTLTNNNTMTDSINSNASAAAAPSTPSESRELKKGSLAAFKGLVPFLRPYRAQFAMAGVALVVAAGATLAIPAAFKQMIDLGFGASAGVRSIEHVNLVFLALFGVATILALATAARFYTVSWLGERVTADIRSAVYRHCLLYTSPSPRDLSTSRMPSSA